MQVILLEKIRNLGDLGAQVNVKSGYGRNYLFPQGKAVPANSQNIEKFEQQRAELEQKAQEILQDAQARAEKLSAMILKIDVMASDEGKLYGSVGVSEIVKAVKDAGEVVEKREVIMPEGPIHALGEFDIDIQVHSDVTAPMKVVVGSAK